jgi:FlaG/FlaF family flagellin (archaellin)
MTTSVTHETRATRRLGKLAAGAAVAVLAASYLGCGMFGGKSEQTMHSSSSTPAAQGTVKASPGDNGNTDLSVRVEHLAPPSKLVSDATVYVVWIQPANAAIQNVGAMKLNKHLEGRLDTVTSQSRFKLMVTPEAGPSGAQPTNQPVFTSDVERRD